jgi:hypothetical protein
MDMAHRDRRYLAREEAFEVVQFARSESCFLFDQHGKKYADFRPAGASEVRPDVGGAVKVTDGSADFLVPPAEMAVFVSEGGD